MYINNLPLRVKFTFFFVVAALLSFLLHYVVSYSTEREIVFITIGIIMSIFSIVFIILNIIAYKREN